MQKDGWAKYVRIFGLNDANMRGVRRALGNKNENAKYVSFLEKALFDVD